MSLAMRLLIGFSLLCLAWPCANSANAGDDEGIFRYRVTPGRVLSYRICFTEKIGEDAASCHSRGTARGIELVLVPLCANRRRPGFSWRIAPRPWDFSVARDAKFPFEAITVRNQADGTIQLVARHVRLSEKRRDRIAGIPRQRVEWVGNYEYDTAEMFIRKALIVQRCENTDRGTQAGDPDLIKASYFEHHWEARFEAEP